MRYKLLKELPTFKAGTEAWLSEHGNLITIADGEILVIYSGLTLAKFPNILTKWFTPVEEKRNAVPEYEDKFYVIETGGSIWKWTFEKEHNLLNQGNWRWTREEAELEVKKRAAIERVRRYLVSNDLLEEDKNENYYFIFSYRNKISSESARIKKHYSPYGRIKNTDLTQFIEDCREDLLLIHS